MRSTRSRRKKSLKTDAEISSAEPFNRLNDAYFKSVMASPERKHITIAFLNALMSHAYSEGFPEIEDIEFLDREAVTKWEGEKVPRFDVFLRAFFCNNVIEDRLFHIEVQDARDNFFMKRGFFYSCRDYAGQSERGHSYEDFKPVIFTGLLNFGLYGESDSPPEWYNLHKVLNMFTHKCDCDLLDMHFAELSMLRRKWRRVKHKPSTKFEELMFYFGNVGGKSMGDTLVQEIAENNPVVADLLEYEKEFRTDPLLMRQYVFAERAHYDYLANLKYEREEGREIGLKEGLKEGREEGFKEGRAKGLEEGLLKGLATGREEGLLKGFVKGRDEGLTEGREEERKTIVRTIRADGTMTDEQIAIMLKLPLDFVKNA